MDNLDRPLLGEFYDTVSANPHAYANISAYMSAHPTALSVIDERHYKTSSADFGNGGPTWISGLPHHMPNFVAYFAASKPSGGTNIYVSLKQAVLDKLLEIKFFTTHAKVLF
ncbi:hypothetical protein LPJ77_001516 [Coemansia sp. RSA 2523]|nr:hypothetical protein LPJ77_001516 [Coemansia sp. RSA 2523]KAJ2152076.1 hypothetical protein J3F82_002920 [Coemansia sp. RSA 637]